jgi:integrase
MCIRDSDYIEPAKMPVREYLDRWLRDYAKPRVSPKTYKRYEQIVNGSLKPVLGDHALAKLRPLHIQEYYADALQKGRKDRSGGLSPQTVLHFHRLLHKALSQAVRWQLLARNPATAVEPPRAQRVQMRALDEKETATLIKSVEGRPLYLPTILAIAGGLRRGEILALRWQEVDFRTGRAVICRSLEQTKDGLRFKAPKTERGRRTVVLPAFALDALRSHKAQQAARRLSMGLAYNDEDLI